MTAACRHIGGAVRSWSAMRLAALALVAMPAAAHAQVPELSVSTDPPPIGESHPITAVERRAWIVQETVAPRSLGTGAMIGTWQTALGSPREWRRSSGFTRRVLTVEADNAISTGIEGSLGALWGEDPRVRPSGLSGVRPRLGYAMKTVLLAPRRDGHFAPAWGRVAGAVGSNVVKNAWLPSRHTTGKETALRVASTFATRLGVNVWREFGPDLRKRFRWFGGRRSGAVAKATHPSSASEAAPQ